MGRTQRDIVEQLVTETAVDSQLQPGVAGHIDEDGRAAGVQLFEVFVGQHAGIQAEVFDEVAVAGRGQADDVDFGMQTDAEGLGIAGAARCAGDHHLLGAEEVVFRQKIRQAERSDE